MSYDVMRRALELQRQAEEKQRARPSGSEPDPHHVDQLCCEGIGCSGRAEVVFRDEQGDRHVLCLECFNVLNEAKGPAIEVPIVEEAKPEPQSYTGNWYQSLPNVPDGLSYWITFNVLGRSTKEEEED